MQEQKANERFINIVLIYAVWFALAAGVVALLFLIREAILDLLLHVRGINPWAIGAIDKFGTVILGLVALGLILAIEPYLKGGFKRNIFWKRVLRILLIIGGIAVVAVLILAFF